MADAIALYLAALLVIAGAVVLGAVVRKGRRRARLERRSEPQRLRQRLRELDGLIGQINNARSEDDLDRLNDQRNGDL